MSTRSELREYQRTFDELVQAVAAWAVAHPGADVSLAFPADQDVIGVLADFPEEWCGNETARDLVLYCIGRVPGATIAMFRTCCERAARPH
jgi:hypothetical protein